MAIRSDEPVLPASVQYNDYVGTAAADGHGGASLRELADIVGLDLDRYTIVGFEFRRTHLRDGDGLTIFAIDEEALDGLDLNRYVAQHGEVPITDFLVHDLAARDVLYRGLKRLEVQLLVEWLPEGVPLRRVSRDDLNYSGD